MSKTNTAWLTDETFGGDPVYHTSTGRKLRVSECKSGPTSCGAFHLDNIALAGCWLVKNAPSAKAALARAGHELVDKPPRIDDTTAPEAGCQETAWHVGDGVYHTSDGARIMEHVTSYGSGPVWGVMIDYEFTPGDDPISIIESAGYRFVDKPTSGEDDELARMGKCSAHDSDAPSWCRACGVSLPGSLVAAMSAGTADCPVCRASSRRCPHASCRGLLADRWNHQRGCMVKTCIDCGNEVTT